MFKFLEIQLLESCREYLSHLKYVEFTKYQKKQ